MSRKYHFNEQETQDIINLYDKEKISLQKIGEKYKVSKEVVSRILKENNIEIRKGNHKYYADYNKFHIIDSKEKAYWLGFIAADGYVYKRPENNKSGNFLGINIHRKDKDHLEKFKKFMESNTKIIDHIQNKGFSNNTPMSKIIINSNILVEDLIDKEITPKKSLTLKPPKIKEEFFNSYILGYFDGDGSIYQNINGEFGINITGTKETLEWINNILNISNNLEQKKETDKNIYYIRCGGTNKPYNIMKKLYEDCPIYLDRKFEIYKQLETVVFNRNIK